MSWSGIGVPTWQTPTLLNGWSSFGSGYRAAGWILDGPWVTIRGLVTGGVADAYFFVLPEGFRPSATETFDCRTATGSTQIDVGSDGGVRGPVNTVNTWVSLAGIRFSTD